VVDGLEELRQRLRAPTGSGRLACLCVSHASLRAVVAAFLTWRRTDGRRTVAQLAHKTKGASGTCQKKTGVPRVLSAQGGN
jgi:hypothetical protein